MDVIETKLTDTEVVVAGVVRQFVPSRVERLVLVRVFELVLGLPPVLAAGCMTSGDPDFADVGDVLPQTQSLSERRAA